MGSVLYMAFLFFAKMLDNALSTAKTIQIQRNRCLLAGVCLAVSNYIYLLITKDVVSSDSKDVRVMKKLIGSNSYPQQWDFLSDILPGAQHEWDMEYTQQQTGESRWFHTVALCSDVQGDRKFILVLSDRTADKKVNLALEEAVHSAQSANRAKSTFLSNMSSCIIVMLLAYVYHRFRGLGIVQGILAGLRPAVIAMIASAGISLLILAIYGQKNLPSDPGNVDAVAVVIFLASFLALRKWKCNPLWIIAGAGAAGILLYFLF